MLERLTLLLATSAALTFAPATARAHWCHDLWASSYNIVVRPAADSVTVGAGGSETLDIWVQNNMGYALVNFALGVDDSGIPFGVSVSSETPKVSGYLMPGERLRHILTVTSAGGGALQATDIPYYISFGNGGQDSDYPYGSGGAVVTRLSDGSLGPSRPLPGLGSAMFQALHLGSAAQADFGDLGAGISSLLDEYCAGRGSWNASNGSILRSSYCPNETSTTCPSRPSRSDTKFDWQHLWATAQLAVRMDAMSSGQLDEFRDRMICGWNDSHIGFVSFLAPVMGYVGPSTALRNFVQGLADYSGGDSRLLQERTLARMTLHMWGDSGYATDVNNALSDGDAYIEMVAGAVRGITDSDDAAVETELINRVDWIQPDGTSNEGRAMIAAHLLDLVAWHRRGWAIDAADAGVVSFYNTVVDNTDPAAPAQPSCTVRNGDTLRVSWPQVTLDTGGDPETVTVYRLYWGTTPNPDSGANTRPGSGWDYDHVDGTSGTWIEPSPTTPGTTYYFSVTAGDAAGNVSVYSGERACDAPVPPRAPTAVINCDQTSGDIPLTVTCNSNSSSDPDGNIAFTYFSLDGGTAVDQTTWTDTFTTAGGHTLVLRVVDSTSPTPLEDTDQVDITATDPASLNAAPVADAIAIPTSGLAPLSVDFNGSGSSDPDVGDTLSFLWDFADNGATSTQTSPTYVFNTAGTYNVSLVVTDDAASPLSDTAVVSITVIEPQNSAPDVSAASASPLFGPVPLDVHFDATGVYDPDGDNFTLTWDFGDSTPLSTATEADHTYADAAIYTATLTAQDDGTPSVGPATATFQINAGVANLAPDASGATVTPVSGEPPLEVTFDASGVTDPNGDTLTFAWSVADLVYEVGNSTEQTWQMNFDQPGTYTAVLSVTDSGSPSLQDSVEFTFNVLGQGSSDPVTLIGGCACSGGAAMPLMALAVLALRRRRRTK